jgi:hypothetical protein
MKEDYNEDSEVLLCGCVGALRKRRGVLVCVTCTCVRGHSVHHLKKSYHAFQDNAHGGARCPAKPTLCVQSIVGEGWLLA